MLSKPFSKYFSTTIFSHKKSPFMVETIKGDDEIILLIPQQIQQVHMFCRILIKQGLL